MTRCRGSELRQAIPKDFQGITLDNRPIECVPLRNCAREETVLVLMVGFVLQTLAEA